MTKDQPKRPRIRIRQNARVVHNTSGPITVRGVTAYDSDGKAVGRVGVDRSADEDDE
jgi:hypothetical protein